MSIKKLIGSLKYGFNSKNKWQEELSLEISEEIWKKIFILSKNITVSSQLHIFQYKMIHRILPTNKWLHKCNLRENPFCINCLGEIEDLLHYFYGCPLVQTLWQNIADWLSPELDLYPSINAANIILGICDTQMDLQNAIILLIKRYIFLCKIDGKNLNTISAKCLPWMVYHTCTCVSRPYILHELTTCNK